MASKLSWLLSELSWPPARMQRKSSREEYWLSPSTSLGLVQPGHGLCKRCITTEAGRTCLHTHSVLHQQMGHHCNACFTSVDVVHPRRVFSWTWGRTWWYLNVIPCFCMTRRVSLTAQACRQAIAAAAQLCKLCQPLRNPYPSAWTLQALAFSPHSSRGPSAALAAVQGCHPTACSKYPLPSSGNLWGQTCLQQSMEQYNKKP